MRGWVLALVAVWPGLMHVEGAGERGCFVDVVLLLSHFLCAWPLSLGVEQFDAPHVVAVEEQVLQRVVGNDQRLA